MLPKKILTNLTFIDTVLQIAFYDQDGLRQWKLLKQSNKILVDNLNGLLVGKSHNCLTKDQ